MDARALTENLAALLRREHDALAAFLVALADFDQRRLWVEMGHSSLFYYLHRELRLSKGAAQYRAPAAPFLEEGLELLLAQAAKRRGLVERPQKKIRRVKGDHIPAHVRREVWKRDGGRCQYPLASGGICGATRQLELDYIHPKSLGGPSTVDNLRVTCRGHNDLAARNILGDELMDRYGCGLRGAAWRSRSAGADYGAPATSPR